MQETSSAKINNSRKHSKVSRNMIHSDKIVILQNDSAQSVEHHQENQRTDKKSEECKISPEADYKCLLCNITVTPGSIKTFNLHLKSCHFNNELRLDFMTKQAPYICTHDLCYADPSTKTEHKRRQFNSSVDLLDHMIDSHNLVLNMYNERVKQKISGRINFTHSADAINYNTPSNINCNSGKEKISMCDDESVFVCMICRNKNGLINGYRRCNGLDEDIFRNNSYMIAPGVFVEEKHLRTHLIDVHFQDLIIKYAEKEMKTFLSRSPIVCPIFQCRKEGLSFKEENTFQLHFLQTHHEQLNLPRIDGSISLDMALLFQSNLQRICLDCDHIANVSRSSGIHMCKEHPARLDKLLNKLAMKNTLLPVKKSCLGISWGKYALNHEAVTATNTPKISSEAKKSKSLHATQKQCYNATTGKRKGEVINNSVLKSKLMKIDNEEHQHINSKQNRAISYTTKDSAIVNGKVNVIDINSQQSIKKKPQNTFRPPTKSEMDSFLKDCYSKPYCRCCEKQVWNPADSRGVRLSRLCKHLFREHFFQEIRASVIDLLCQMKTSQRCPHCQEEFKETELMEHMAVFHRRVLKSYWEYVTFTKTAYSVMKSRSKAGTLQLATKLNKLGEESGKTLEIQRIDLQKKLGELAVGDVITQPDACFNVSSTLNHCHECWKIHNGITPQVKGTVCQFAGFRKIRKTRKNYQELSEFEEAGFLDPFKDPSDADCSLWKISEEHLHPNITVDIAKFVLQEAGDEFCNMIYDEENVIKEFIQERRKVGKSPSVLWKRLQPQVREMCDVCSTSLFNIHWTCTTCGCLICIDCYRTRKKGYPLMYSSAGKNAGKTISVPHKSRRKTRNDIDDHFWPFCKNNIRHNPSRFE